MVVYRHLAQAFDAAIQAALDSRQAQWIRDSPVGYGYVVEPHDMDRYRELICGSRGFVSWAAAFQGRGVVSHPYGYFCND